MQNIFIPGSKSHTIRCYMFALLSRSKCRIKGALNSSDTNSAKKFCIELGAIFTALENGDILIDSTNLKTDREIMVDCENSGTTLYFAIAVSCALNVKRITFTGDNQLVKRPVKPLLNAISELGVNVRSYDFPIIIEGGFKTGCVSISCPTSQYLSSLLIALPFAKGDFTIDVPLLNEKPYVDITLFYLNKFNIKYVCKKDYSQFKITGGQKIDGFTFCVPGDFSSATFFFVLSVIKKIPLTFENLDIKDSQGDKEILKVLSSMGADVRYNENLISIDCKNLVGKEIDLNSMPDALPALSVASLFASGRTKIYNVAQARIKETDRIACMAKELKKLGGLVKENKDGLEIEYSYPYLKGCLVSGYGDHRIIMALKVLSCAVDGIKIDDERAVSVTFPTFVEKLEKVVNNFK